MLSGRPSSISNCQRWSMTGRTATGGCEIKYDGYRTQMIVEGARACAFARRGINRSDKYPHLATAAAELPVEVGHRR